MDLGAQLVGHLAPLGLGRLGKGGGDEGDARMVLADQETDMRKIGRCGKG